MMVMDNVNIFIREKKIETGEKCPQEPNCTKELCRNNHRDRVYE